jgi:hypothetical protein
VFGDSIGCAIVQHLSRKELEALDNQETLSTNDSNTVVPLLVPNNTTTHPSNHVTPVTYNNPTFINQSETIPDDDDNTLARTNF